MQYCFNEMIMQYSACFSVRALGYFLIASMPIISRQHITRLHDRPTSPPLILLSIRTNIHLYERTHTLSE